nr:ribonuclease H-like domain-containing protein [Tanacetum cinerariifolium]
MLLMQAQENGVALDEKQLLFIAADDCDAFDSDVDEAPTAHTVFMANLSSADPVSDEAGLSYDLDILCEVHDHYHYQDAVCEHHEVHEMHDDVQPNYVVDSLADYTSDSNMIMYDQDVKDNAVPVVQMHNSEETLEIAEITRKKMNEKINDPECVKKKIKITPHDYSKENYLATFTPQKQLTPKQIFWSKDLIKMKAKALIEQTTTSRPMKALTVKHDETERKNILNANDNLIADCLSKDVFYTITDSMLTVSRFYDMNEALNAAQKRISKLESKNSNLQNKIQNDDHDVMVNHFSKLEVEQLNLQLKYQHLKESFDNKKSVTSSDAPTFDLVFVIGQLKDQIQSRGNTIHELREKISRLTTKHSEESVETLREIVKEAKVERPLDRSLASACLYSKHSQELLEYTMHQTNKPTIPSTGVNGATANGSKPRSKTKKDMTLQAKSDMQKVEVHPRNNNSRVKQNNRVDSSISYKHSGCSKHMTEDCSWLRNFMKKFIGTVRFKNDHFGAIMGYGDYVIVSRTPQQNDVGERRNRTLVEAAKTMLNSSTKTQQAATMNRGKEIVNSPQPIYDQEPSMVDDDDDETSKEKEIDKLMALISLSF